MADDAASGRSAVQLTLPPSLVKASQLDVELSCMERIRPAGLSSLGPLEKLSLTEVDELVAFVAGAAEEDRVYFASGLQRGETAWEYVAVARRGPWTIFCSVLSTRWAFRPEFGDGERRSLCAGGTRIVDRAALAGAVQRDEWTREGALREALSMNLDLSAAMSVKNLTNGFNIAGSKSLVLVEGNADGLVERSDVGDFAGFMARFHNSVLQGLPVFVGTGADLNFKEHGDAYYDLCSELSPCYFGNPLAARRWQRSGSEDTAGPTARGVIAALDAVCEELQLQGRDRSILVKGLGGIGRRVARHALAGGWEVYATDTKEVAQGEELEGVRWLREDEWSTIERAAIFSPNSSSGSLTEENIGVLRKIGVRAVVGGENNVRARGLSADTIYRETGILTFADFLLNGGGAWIVAAEMVERDPEQVTEWIHGYQVPTVLRTLRGARLEGRSPESLFVEFMDEQTRALLH